MRVMHQDIALPVNSKYLSNSWQWRKRSTMTSRGVYFLLSLAALIFSHSSGTLGNGCHLLSIFCLHQSNYQEICGQKICDTLRKPYPTLPSWILVRINPDSNTLRQKSNIEVQCLNVILILTIPIISK